MLGTNGMTSALTHELHLRQFNGNALRLDRLDIKILVALQTDGRMTNLRLAELVGLSPTPCLQRVRRLEASGYIRTYEAVLDITRLAPHIVVFTQVTLSSQRYDDAQRFERFVNAAPVVLACFGVGSGYDYLIQSVARDITHYQELVDALLSDPISVKHVASFITLKTVKQTRIFPLGIFDPANCAVKHRT